MPRLVIVSNRLPITINKSKGELHFYPSAGGLATGLSSLDQTYEKIWIGWPGQAIAETKEQQSVAATLASSHLIPVFLSDEEIELYYEGFSNKTIWPHFHYFTQYTTYNDEYWEAYQAVNHKFAEVVIANVKKDDLVWIHDYQLLLLPAMIRAAFPDVSIGFFLHIPFPSYEIFRILPWRAALLEGVLGADQVGFHTYGYMRHFLSAAYRISGYEHNFGKLAVGKRIVNVDVFPMGIDYDKYAFPERIADISESSRIIERLLSKGRKLIISIDRLDYTKGIPNRIRVFEQLIRNYKAYRGKVTLMLIVVPSRSNVDQYQELKDEVDTLVGRIDGEFRTFGWSPIQYFYRSFNFADLTALYRAADIAMITPLRDGMNLVAKEFIASKETNKKGVLILSEMAGAASELSDALIINPQDSKGMLNALLKALEMPVEEQAERLDLMAKKLKRYTVKHWAQTFIKEQSKMSEQKKLSKSKLLSNQDLSELLQAYRQAKRRLLLLDYDGTLMSFQNDPTRTAPDEALLNCLQRLVETPGNKMVVISGRDRHTLGKWLGPLNIEMSAEHGAWFYLNQLWQTSTGLSSNWKEDVRPVLENMVQRTPGSFIEEKEFSLAWHYRRIDKDLGAKRIREYRDVLQYLTANLDLQVLEGNKVVEIKNSGINKGKASLRWLGEANWDFILAIGDDSTDEDTFRAVPPSAWTIKVGLGQTAARYHLIGVENVRSLLGTLGEQVIDR
ncbi:MAG: bifunctional alpha,alpha-trehalose-phosphate synthase (UDP-forming)/trehalose-phosphatase [Bacteroidota bacterium]